jgi:hypothetical protein
MRFALRLILCLASCLIISNCAAMEIITADVCIYGGTAAGVAAAVEVERAGKTAVIAEPGYHLGGMSSGGLSQTDIGNKGAIGGISREFYQRMGKHYGRQEQWSFEPSVAENIFFQFVNEAKVPVYFQQRLAEVKKDGSRIVEITMENGKVYRAKMFIDASYEGDLLARAGVSYAVGREANSEYHETLDGIRGKTPKHQFVVAVDPYKKPGDPASGLLPLIQSGDLGTPGAADKCVQAYNFRMCLTQNTNNQIPIAAPKKYDPAQYELLARYIEALDAAGKPPKLGDLMHIQAMPNGKTDINNNGGFSTDFIGADYDYPEGDYARRAIIWQAHEDYTRGFFHFLATSPRVPESLRKQMQSWGLAKDEFCDTGGWPHQLYIREARRMISDYVMTENNCRHSIKLPDAIALAAYTMDSHNCRRIVIDGRAENEGDTQVGGFPPYQIAYRAIVPKESECANLVVPVCLSSTHIAYGSIRMEPVFMVLGQSAAAAACEALDEKTALQKIDVGRLQKKLLAEHQILDWPAK